MSNAPDNRRRFHRILFTVEDNINGTLSIPGGENRPISVKILNLGEGGIHFVVYPKDNDKIKTGAKLILLQIEGPDPLRYLVNVDAEVKWVLNHNIMEHVGVGCEFLNIPENSRMQIRSFVASWREKEDSE